MKLFSRAPRSQANVIAILGMHRSGTSCLAGSLQAKGLFLGEVHEWNEHNRKGNRENEAIASLNEELLNYNKASWHQPAVVTRWTRAHRKARDRIIAEFAQAGVECWGFKDTRATFTYPFWRDALPDLKPVGTFRHPLLVAQSLNKRDNMPVDYAIGLWCQYNRQLLDLHGLKPFPLISFDLNAADYIGRIEAMVAGLNLPDPAGAAFLDHTLKTSSAELAADALTTDAQEIYAKLQDLTAR